MKIAIIAPSPVPFVVGGAEKFWWGLSRSLGAIPGNFVDVIKIPNRENTFWELYDSYREFARLDLSHFDMVISTKYPAWMVRHHNHVVYMQHKLRGLYDTYHFTGLPETCDTAEPALQPLLRLIRGQACDRETLAEVWAMLDALRQKPALADKHFPFPGPLVREIIHFFDRVALAPDAINTYLAIAENVKGRKDYFPKGVPVRVIHHPSDLEGLHQGKSDYIFTASRLVNCKRIHLLIEAMRSVTGDIKFLIGGTGPELDRYRALAGDDPRIEFLGYISDERIVDLYANALFVPFVPYDEDYGLITIEAMQSGKPVLTATDSGGVCEFVVNGKTGFCVPPDAKHLGEAMQKMVSDRELTLAMGQAAKKAVEHIDWPHTAAAVLKAAKDNATTRPKLLVVTTFPVYPPIGGGQKRIFNLFGELAAAFDVTLLTIGDRGQQGQSSIPIGKGFVEKRLPWSASHIALDEELGRATGACAGDVAAMCTCREDGALLAALAKEAQDATFVVASHPFLFPAIRQACGGVPLIYDAHNVEYDMKATVLGDGDAAKDVLRQVFEVEKACCQAAQYILSCSEQTSQRFTELYGQEIGTLLDAPNGCDVQNILVTTRQQRGHFKTKVGSKDHTLALFIGSLHKPNIEAVAAITKLAGQTPDIQYLIVGSVCQDKSLDGALPANVHLLGMLGEDEKNAVLQTVDLGLNPMLSGAGTNLKTLEYVAGCLPVVTTPFGVRGLGPELPETVTVAPIEDFAAAIGRVCANPPSDAALQTGRDWVRHNFGWREIASRLMRSLEKQ